MSEKEQAITHTFKVAGMHCANCALGIDLELENLEGVKSAETSLVHGVTTLTVDSENFDYQLAYNLIRELGYGVIEE